MGGDSALFHPLPVIPHKAQMPLPPIQPTLLYYAVANTLPPPMQPLCGMGALIPMPPTRLMPPASTNCAVCHFRGMCLAYPAYPPNPQSQTLPQQPAAAGFDCDPGVTPTLLAKAVPLLNIHFHRALLWLCFFQLWTSQSGLKICIFCRL